MIKIPPQYTRTYSKSPRYQTTSVGCVEPTSEGIIFKQD